MTSNTSPDFSARLARLRSRLDQSGADALLVFALDNLRYLCNYSGEAAYGVVTHDSLHLITDYRFVEQAEQESVGCKVICRNREHLTLGGAIHDILQSVSCRSVLFEAEHVTVQAWRQIAEELRSRSPALQIGESTGMVEQLRKTKDDWEVAQIRAAAAIADQALADLLPQIKAGVSERELALELEYRMQRLSAEGLSFATILGFGERSAQPHAIPSARRLQVGDLIVIDFGAVVNGYRSDMTRTYVLGAADQRQRAIYDTVYAAQQAALATLHSGLPATAAAAAADEVLQASPFAAYAGRGLGHGVGLKLHEQPFISATCKNRLQSGYVVTIEPGIYIPGYGGVRIEDDVLITERGYEYLTHAPKQFELEA